MIEQHQTMIFSRYPPNSVAGPVIQIFAAFISTHRTDRCQICHGDAAGPDHNMRGSLMFKLRWTITDIIYYVVLIRILLGQWYILYDLYKKN